MAMYPCLSLPSLSFPSVSGSLCTFNSQYAGLPLKSHVVEVDYTGSAISGVNIGSDAKYAGFINFNQLLNALATSTTQDGLIITNNNDGSVSISGTAEATGSVYLTDDVTAPRDNSVILFNFIFSSALSGGNYVFFTGYRTNYAMTERGCFFKRDEGTSWRNGFSLHYEQGTTINTRIWFNIHNLTQMFGSTKADEIYQMEQQTVGRGVAYFRSLFPNNYYDYNAGILTTVSAVNGVNNSFIPITFDTPIYGGQYDCLTGIVTSNKDSGGGDITPTYQQTATANCVTSLGENNIWADTGDTTLQYSKFG